MKNHVSKEIALSVLKAIFSAGDVRRLAKLRGVILCGFPGCGKTTIANLLEDAFGFERLSTDQIRTKELFKGQQHRMASEHEQVMVSRYLVYGELARRANQKLNSRGRVVVDGTNLDPKRWGVLGGMLSRVAQEKVGMVVIRTPEWIIKSRFRDISKEKYDQWWSVYSYWKSYYKQGKARFPTKKELPRVQIIKPKRYAIRTFEWIPKIKAVGWDLDGTLYSKKTVPWRLIRRRQYLAVAKANGWSYQRAKKEYEKKLRVLGSNTRTMTALGIDGPGFFTDLWDSLDLEKYIKKDNRMRKTINSLKHLQHFIISNSNRLDQIETKLRLIGLSAKMFRTIVSTVGLGVVKPDVKPFKLALKQLKVKAEEVLYVGDRVGTDVRGANRAGMRSCLVKGRSQEADVCLKTSYEVAELFGKEI